MQDAEASPGPGTPADASAMAALELPEGLELVRVTDRFDARTVPAGLLRAHRVAAGVWGELCVLEGEVGFVFEASGARRVVRAGGNQVIPPAEPHHVEPSDGASFEVRFHR